MTVKDNEQVVKQLSKYKVNLDTQILTALSVLDEKIGVLSRNSKRSIKDLIEGNYNVKSAYFTEEYGKGTYTTPNLNWTAPLRKAITPKRGSNFVAIEVRQLDLSTTAFILQDRELLRNAERFGGDIISALRPKFPHLNRYEIKELAYATIFGKEGTGYQPNLFEGLARYKGNMRFEINPKTKFGTTVVSGRSGTGSRFYRLIRTTATDLMSRAVVSSGELKKLAFSFHDTFIFELKKEAKIGHIIDAFRKPFKEGPELTVRYTIGNNLAEVSLHSAFSVREREETYW